MKSLYESILSSTKSGVKSLIKEWCDENRIFNGNYEINDKGEITKKSTKRDTMIFLDLHLLFQAIMQVPFGDNHSLPAQHI